VQLLMPLMNDARADSAVALVDRWLVARVFLSAAKGARNVKLRGLRWTVGGSKRDRNAQGAAE
jgi:hypothetical protein